MEKPDGREFRRVMNLKRELIPSEYAYIADFMFDMAHYWKWTRKAFKKSTRIRNENDCIYWGNKYREYARVSLIRLACEVKQC